MNESIWDRYAPVYESIMRTNRKSYEWIYERIPVIIDGKTVLEVAAGPGMIARHVAEAADWMYATDYSQKMIRAAQKKGGPENLIFEQADAADLPYDDDTFDVVIIVNALHLFPDPEKVMAEIDRVLNKNGILIAPTFVHEEGGRVSRIYTKMLKSAGVDIQYEWTAEEYEAFLQKNGWRVVNRKNLKGAIPIHMHYTECVREPAVLPGFDEDQNQEPDYGNWISKRMIAKAGAGAGVLTAGAVCTEVFGKDLDPKLRHSASAVLGLGAFGLSAAASWLCFSRSRYSYKGKRQLSKQIVEGTAEFINLPEGGLGLDVGCGSGALTNACAKRNPQAHMIGVDRWGRNCKSYSLKLCEKNAEAEGLTNVTFQTGSAVSLDFPDEYFDAVTSNYVYHNIIGEKKQELLRETLRVLKKGGTFAIHDIMGRIRFGDMEAFADELMEEGYQEVVLIDTAKGEFMNPAEARILGLRGSTLLYGIK